MHVTNAKPIILKPYYDYHISGQFDPMDILKAVTTDQLLTPTIPGSQVKITSQGNNISEDDILTIIDNCLSDSKDTLSEVQAKQFLSKTMINYDQSWDMPVDELFCEQSGIASQLPEPTPNMAYTPASDVIPASKGFLAGTCDFDFWFASLAFYARPDTLGVAFVNEIAFDNFKTWADAKVQSVSAGLPSDTLQTWSSFNQSTTLNGLTESFWLRKDPSDGNEDFSFARLITYLFMDYTKNISPNQAYMCPFSLTRLVLPESIVLINIERHAQATPKEIASEWKLINNSIKASIRVLRPGQVQSMTAVARNAAKIARAAAQASNQNASPNYKAKQARFKKNPPTITDIVSIVRKVLAKMAFVNHSQNIYKSTKMSFARPNRRDPDDFNKQGKVVSTRYLPDIHLYVDTSGSISEEQYQDAVKACISLARKLDINLYFNSFSHVMTTTTFLPTKGRSAKQVWKYLQRVPKVTGGTDFGQIWEYILASKKRKRELSLIITDFEWYPPKRYVEHPKNLYYLPIGNTRNYDILVREASTFANNMRHIDPNIRQKILF